MVAIIVLNWNGWGDTIDCLKSISQITYQDYFVFVGDNGSKNDSKQHISSYCKGCQQNPAWYRLDEKIVDSTLSKKIYLFDLKVNHGFAKGNNMLIKAASQYNPDYYLLLNNDTVIEPSFLNKLVDYQSNNPSVKVLTPVIYYYNDRYKIWNAGGNLFWGIRKYHFADEYNPTITDNEFISCTFITGCALFFVPEVLVEDHKLFTEDFFHGEEDFDFSLRMKKRRVKMGCVTRACIFHKVGGTSGNIGNKVGLTYCYYLNRFINLRHHLNFFSFYSFIVVYFPYVIRLLVSKGIPFKKAICFYLKVILESHRLEGVSFEKFMQCVRKEKI